MNSAKTASRSLPDTQMRNGYTSGKKGNKATQAQYIQLQNYSGVRSCRLLLHYKASSSRKTPV